MIMGDAVAGASVATVQGVSKLWSGMLFCSMSNLPRDLFVGSLRSIGVALVHI
jgi:hypothetical protein